MSALVRMLGFTLAVCAAAVFSTRVGDDAVTDILDAMAGMAPADSSRAWAAALNGLRAADDATLKRLVADAMARLGARRNARGEFALGDVDRVLGDAERGLGDALARLENSRAAFEQAERTFAQRRSTAAAAAAAGGVASDRAGHDDGYGYALAGPLHGSGVAASSVLFTPAESLARAASDSAAAAQALLTAIRLARGSAARARAEAWQRVLGVAPPDEAAASEEEPVSLTDVARSATVAGHRVRLVSRDAETGEPHDADVTDSSVRQTPRETAPRACTVVAAKTVERRCGPERDAMRSAHTLAAYERCVRALQRHQCAMETNVPVERDVFARDAALDGEL